MYKKLFTPYKIGNVEIPNRLAVSAMVSNYCTSDGFATDQYIAYHEAKAKGGWGLIITEDYGVNETAKGYRFIGGLWKDEQIAGHKQLTERVHQYGSKIFAQIYHAGRQSRSFTAGVQPVAPSAIPCPWNREMPRELTIPEIQKIVNDFGDTALRAKKAGFDGVEIHGAHGYLIAQFMSNYSNKRTDEYGGCLLNRVRFAREVIENIRSKVGKDFAVTFRISGDEVIPGGRDMAETRVIARLLEAWGIDAIHVSSGVYGNYGIATPMGHPHGWAVKYAEEVKKLVNIPVITVNRINDPLMADGIIDSGKADFVAMGRGSLADPELPKKAMSGKAETIRYCIGCMQGCTGSLSGSLGQDGPIRCALNPTIGYEATVDLSPAKQKKKVYIAGGGPGGMEAARGAAIKGHEVHLFESSDALGGQFRAAAFAPYKGDIASYNAWSVADLKARDNVTIHMNTPLTREIVEEGKPETVIVATGATPIVPKIPGIDRSNVVTAQDALTGKAVVGDVIFIAGAGSVGMELAAHLAIQLRKVCVADMLPCLAPEEDPDIRLVYQQILDQYGVDQLVNAKVVEIAESGVLYEKNGQTMLYPCQSVVLAFGSKPSNTLSESLTGLDAKVVTVGDCVKVAKVMQATNAGFFAGLEA